MKIWVLYCIDDIQNIVGGLTYHLLRYELMRRLKA
jgi:hypothetical protein